MLLTNQIAVSYCFSGTCTDQSDCCFSGTCTTDQSDCCQLLMFNVSNVACFMLLSVVSVSNFDVTGWFISRYRMYTLKDGSGLLVRCQHDATLPPTTPGASPDQFINIKALNEWDPKVTSVA